MIWQIKALAIKPGSLSSVQDTHALMVERTDYGKLSSDFHVHVVGCIHLYMYTHTHGLNVILKVFSGRNFTTQMEGRRCKIYRKMSTL